MFPLISSNTDNVRNISAKKQFDPSHSVFHSVTFYIGLFGLMKAMKAKHRQKRSNTEPLEK